MQGFIFYLSLEYEDVILESVPKKISWFKLYYRYVLDLKQLDELFFLNVVIPIYPKQE